MRIRSQRAALYCWRPDNGTIRQAQRSTTECRGIDLDRMLNPDKGPVRDRCPVRDCHPYLDWDVVGALHHYLDLDDGFTKSFARLDANLNDSAAFTVHQLGPRRLWYEVEAAYDWWYEQGEPRFDRFGIEVRDGAQWLWLDEPAKRCPPADRVSVTGYGQRRWLFAGLGGDGAVGGHVVDLPAPLPP